MKDRIRCDDETKSSQNYNRMKEIELHSRKSRFKPYPERLVIGIWSSRIIRGRSEELTSDRHRIRSDDEIKSNQNCNKLKEIEQHSEKSGFKPYPDRLVNGIWSSRIISGRSEEYRTSVRRRIGSAHDETKSATGGEK